MSEVKNADRNDPLGDWLEMGRVILERYWPDTTHAVLVAEQGNNRPAVQLVIPTADPSVSVPLRLPPE